MQDKKHEYNKIIYFSYYPEDVLSKIFKNIKISQAAQKLNKLIVQGFAKKNVIIDVVFYLECNNIYSIKNELSDLKNNNIKYYCIILKTKIKYILNINNTIKLLKELVSDDNYCFIFADILKPYILYAALFARIKKRPFVALVTDLVDDVKASGKGVKGFILRLYQSFMFYGSLRLATHLILMTPEMERKLNRRKKPFLIMEGVADDSVVLSDNRYDPSKLKKKICLYSGAVSVRFGLPELVEAFSGDQLSDVELHIYGGGDYADRLEEISKKNTQIKYWGVVDNEIVVTRQQEATLLVNPRPTKESYTLYSFPSKNMEYMYSGRPVLTTRLAGIPAEYWEYCYPIDDESPEGIRKAVRTVVDRSEDELAARGAAARTFVLEKKNGRVQAQRILDMIESSWGTSRPC